MVMLLPDGKRLYTATDLVNYLGCRHCTFLDLRQLEEPAEIPDADPHLELLRLKGLEHEKHLADAFASEGRQVVSVDQRESLPVRVAITREAMAAGVEVIYQGALLQPPWHGYSDFLLRTNAPSKLGGHSYEAMDAKLGRSAQPKYVIQLCVYSVLIAAEQRIMPKRVHIVLGDGAWASVLLPQVIHYFNEARRRFAAFCANPPARSIAEPCVHCSVCRWLGPCEDEWDRTDHLSLVANITSTQRAKLQGAGIATMGALAAVGPENRIPKLQAETFARLAHQARLQTEQRRDGRDRYDLLPLIPGKGFARLPRPDPGDVFFDMEGDPHMEGGLEYLFGLVVHAAETEPRFLAFWAHDRAEEKRAFQAAIDFMVERLAAHPGAHVYHYGHYEPTALKRLAMFHGTRESEVDDLLRHHKLVDLYKVVREGLRISEPAYSIKNLERFYMEQRAGEVKTAGESIVVYESWRRLGDPTLLQQIADYNEADCRSTRLLRNWLLSMRPANASWFNPTVDAPVDPDRKAAREEAEERAAEVARRLLDGIPEADTSERGFRELIAHLLEFHRREARPEWWAMFHRQELSEEELIDDMESIGGLRPLPTRPPRPVKRSIVATFTFPPQDFKLRVGDRPLRAATLEPAGEIVELDEKELFVSLKVGCGAAPFDEAFSIIPGGPVDTRVLRDAVYRYAASVAARDGRYAAVTSILRKERPLVSGIAPGEPIVPPEVDPSAGAVRALCGLRDSYMLIQGPPGAGKTHTSAYAIVELLRRGNRVGVSSNSHKAINTLLATVEEVAKAAGVRFRGSKKCSGDDHCLGGIMIADVFDNAVATGAEFQLVAGTAWLFAREELDAQLDYVFIDEAGQVSLANVIAIGVSTRNVVLVGDQMQLAQPIQGSHPGGSGLSALGHLLGDLSTVPPDRGIFLATTRRMHPDVCRFISEAVYDGRLMSDPSNANQRLVLGSGVDPDLAPAGIRFVGVEHEGCSQRSEAEGARIRELYSSLLGQHWVDRRGLERPIGTEEILVVSPYNMQVNHLRSVLPAGARVGTVDKFQGQEAPVALISMATSSGDDLPRDIEFLYSRNRLNVAISRAKSLVVVVASPRLLEVPCATIDQMRLVNMLCWVRAFAEGA
jgi:predicted RecB family nuclease